MEEMNQSTENDEADTENIDVPTKELVDVVPEEITNAEMKEVEMINVNLKKITDEKHTSEHDEVNGENLEYSDH